MDDDLAVTVGAEERVVARQRGRGKRSEVSPNEVEMLLNRIGGLLDGAVEVAAGGLRRTLEAVAFDIVEPAVIRAGDAALFDAAVGKRGAAVRAAVGEQPEAAAFRTEKHQVLAEDANELRRLFRRELCRRGGRKPVAAQGRARDRNTTLFRSGGGRFSHGKAPSPRRGRERTASAFPP